MDDLASYLLRFGAVALLVFANAFFVATEFALVGVRRSKMEALANEGVRGADVVLDAIGELDRYIAGTQLGITLASLALGWIGESALEGVFHTLFSFLPPVLITMSAPAVTAFLLITFLHVVLGELVPKSLALQYTETTALKVARPMHWAVFVFRPLIWALNSTGNLVLRLFGLSAATEHEGAIHSVEELKILVEDGHRHGILDEMERLMLHRVFKLKHLTARQVMVHRLDIVGIPVEMPYSGLMLAVVDSPFTRYPVYERDIDHVIGILVMKDLIGYRRAAQPGQFDLRALVRAPLFVPETATVETILAQFKRTGMQMAIVLDQFGGTAGLVTLVDLVEELFGEMDENGGNDPFGGDTHKVVQWPITVDARTRLDVLNERYGLSLEDEDADTIAGLVTNRLGRVPSKGEAVTVDDLTIRVLRLEGPRILSVSLARGETPAAPPEEESES